MRPIVLAGFVACTSSPPVPETDPPVFDGIVLEPGDGASVILTFDVPPRPSMDVVFLVDNTASEQRPLVDLEIFGRHDALGLPDAHWGGATYQDYPVEPFGIPGVDLPFRLSHPLSPDPYAVERALWALPPGAGADGPESTMEALFQTLSGTGYDLGCDGRFDAGEDVAPFVASGGDPFAGTAPGAWPGPTPGADGGVGFRAGTIPVVVLSTHAPLRDADVHPVPGGCPTDASFADVVAAAAALDARLVWARSEAAAPDVVATIHDLLAATGSVADLDGDGDDDLLALDLTSGDKDAWHAVLDGALRAIASQGGAYAGPYARLDVNAHDPEGFVQAITPGRFANIDPGTTTTLTVKVDLIGAVPSRDEPLRFDLPVRLRDGFTVLDERILTVWVP